MTNVRLCKTLKNFQTTISNLMKVAEMLENTVGKGESARYEQFLLYQQCFLKTCNADT